MVTAPPIVSGISTVVTRRKEERERAVEQKEKVEQKEEEDDEEEEEERKRNRLYMVYHKNYIGWHMFRINVSTAKKLFSKIYKTSVKRLITWNATSKNFLNLANSWLCKNSWFAKTQKSESLKNLSMWCHNISVSTVGI